MDGFIQDSLVYPTKIEGGYLPSDQGPNDVDVLADHIDTNEDPFRTVLYCIEIKTGTILNLVM